MPVFTPPAGRGRPLAARGEQAWELFKHYAPHAQSPNVYVLDDGTVTENDGLAAEAQKAGLVAHTYHGGHIHTITSAEAVVLTTAGYGAHIQES